MLISEIMSAFMTHPLYWLFNYKSLKDAQVWYFPPFVKSSMSCQPLETTSRLAAADFSLNTVVESDSTPDPYTTKGMGSVVCVPLDIGVE